MVQFTSSAASISPGEAAKRRCRTAVAFGDGYDWAMGRRKVENCHSPRHTFDMRPTFIILSILLFAVIAGGATAWSNYSRLFPKPSSETVHLDAQRRKALIQLRNEEKFEPDDYPPLGYTGVATPEEGVVARSVVNDVLDAILSRQDGPIEAKSVSGLIGRGMKRVNLLETEDRDRTSDYMIEIWYILGFKGSTGQFAYGSAFLKPPGYGEPLPRGWKSPSEPRPIGKP